MIATSVFLPRAASAQTIDGNRLLDLCAAQDPICTGYAMGVADARNNDPHGVSFCVPDGAAGKQLHDVVLKFLRKADRRFPVVLLVAGAFAEAFPCPK
jgi:hypothetical protein